MKNQKIFLSIFLFLSFFILNSSISFAYFDDVSYGLDPYYDAINYLEEKGIVNGYDEGYSVYFKPNNEINRAEFLKIVMEAKYDDINGSNCYPDVKDEWFAPYVCKATDLGIVDGYDDGYFRPADNINFAEASKIIVNTFDLPVSETEGEWFKPYVVALEEKNAISQGIGSFSRNLKRKDMAEMIYRLMANITDKYSNSYELIKAIEEYEGSMDSKSLDSLPYYLQERMNDSKYVDVLPSLAKKYNIKISSYENPDDIDSQTAEEIKLIASAFMDVDYNDTVVGPMNDWIYHASYKGVYFFINSYDGKLFMTDKIDAETFELMGVYDRCMDLYENDLKDLEEDEKKEWCKSFFSYIEMGHVPYGYTVLAKDKNNIYQIKEDSLMILEGIDPEKFVKNSDGPVDIYLANEKDVYYSANYELVLLEGADASTFNYFLGDFYIDDNNVYYFDAGNTAWGNVDDDSMYKIDDADPKTFKFLYLEGIYSFWGDKEDIFVAGRYETTVFPIKGVNPDTAEIYSFTEKKFVPLNSEEIINPYSEFPEGSICNIIISNKKDVYIFNNEESKKIDNLDAETLEFLYEGYLNFDQAFVKDKNGMYFLNGLEVTELGDEDPETFDYYQYLVDHPSVYED